ncbi:MAG: hypothetical protein LQ352_005209 [Teloschistes flavicans]|nr:MAG: hypothetical protein LQ352_005209 [Teloschistes flavicans]
MADNFTKEAFTLLGVGVTVVALRTYARLTSVGIRKFMLDDYLMLLAVVVYGLETGAAYSVGARFHGLANNSMTDEQRRTLSPDSPEHGLRVGGSKLQLIGWSLYTLLLWLLKLCINIFYTRLTLVLCPCHEIAASINELTGPQNRASAHANQDSDWIPPDWHHLSSHDHGDPGRLRNAFSEKLANPSESR